MKESKFQEKVIELLESRGAYVLKTHVSSYQAQGEPDITCCFMGRYVAFELKVDGNTPSKLQEKKMEQIKRAGGYAIAAYTLKDIEQALNSIAGYTAIQVFL